MILCSLWPSLNPSKANAMAKSLQMWSGTILSFLENHFWHTWFFQNGYLKFLGQEEHTILLWARSSDELHLQVVDLQDSCWLLMLPGHKPFQIAFQRKDRRKVTSQNNPPTTFTTMNQVWLRELWEQPKLQSSQLVCKTALYVKFETSRRQKHTCTQVNRHV